MVRIFFRRKGPQDGVFTADKYILPANKPVECIPRFKARDWSGDINELACMSLGGKTGEDPQTFRDELILFGRNAPFSMRLVRNEETLMKSDKVTYFHFDSMFGLSEVTRELARGTKQRRIQVAGLSLMQPAIEGLDYFIQKAHTHISSPAEVARLARASEKPLDLQKLDIGHQTQDVVSGIKELASCTENPKAPEGLECQPVMFLAWRENGDTKVKPIALDPASKSHGKLTISNAAESFCSMPSTLSKIPLVSSGLRDILTRPACVAPPPTEAKTE